MSLTRIIAVVIDTSMFTAYLPNGESVLIPQGDPRTKALLEAMPSIETNGFAEVDLSVTNPYRELQEQLGGVIQFFRIARSKMNQIFDTVEKIAELAAEPTVVPPGSVGSIPSRNERVTGADNNHLGNRAAQAEAESAERQTPKISQQEAVDQIMANATSVASDDFHADRVEETDTIVAVVGDQVIPNAEQMKDHIAHSVKLGSAVGLKKFYDRIAKVIRGREHSVEDLHRFMERNDLPIADDGSLIVYKVLRKKGDRYFDCHTQSVPQRLGSFVCVNEALVDKNRRNECSNGLHVARRGYIAGFGGDVCTIVKVAPEDVITVPHGDPNKVRVCGYHIVMELEKEAWQLLKNNAPMTSNPKAQKMLGRAVSGDHIGIIERVEIRGQLGTDVVVTPIQDKIPSPTKGKKPVTPAVALDDETMKVETSGARAEDVAAAIDNRNKTVQAALNTRQQKASELMAVVETSTDQAHRKSAAQQLLDFKKAAKVSWDKLNVRADQVETLIEVASMEIVEPEDDVLELTEEVPAAPAVQPEAGSTPGSFRQVEARRLYTEGKFTELKAFKAKAKVSWAKLGFYETEITNINNS